MTYVSGGAETQLDLILMRPRSDIIPVDCRSIPGECCATQHRPVKSGFQSEPYFRKEIQRKKKTEILETERGTSKTGVYCKIGEVLGNRK